MLDVVGDDWVGDEIVRGLQDAGVDCRRVRKARGARSPLASVWVEAGTGRRSIAFHPGTVPLRTLDDSDAAAIASSGCLHVNGRHWPVCLDAARIARDAGVLVSFDGGAGRYRDELRELAPMADVCIVAASFAQEWTGKAHPEDQLQAMGSLVPGTVGVTHGTRGSWIAPRHGGLFHQPAYAAVPLVDTTGCGDAYHGAYLFGLLDGRGDRASARLASAVAALAAGQLGGRAGLPELASAEALASTEPP
jgi:sugar/nucleoside kinase (ribokinase family)